MGLPYFIDNKQTRRSFIKFTQDYEYEISDEMLKQAREYLKCHPENEIIPSEVLRIDEILSFYIILQILEFILFSISNFRSFSCDSILLLSSFILLVIDASIIFISLSFSNCVFILFTCLSLISIILDLGDNIGAGDDILLL